MVTERVDISTDVVTKANDLIESSYYLTLTEQKLILACVAQLDGRKPLPKNNVFTLTVSEFQDLFNVNEKNVYRDMEDAAKKLYSRDIRKISKRRVRHVRWVSMIEYRKKEGEVQLEFSSEIAPYLTMLHKRFTSYRLAEVSDLKSVYSIRLYEMLIQYCNTGFLSISLDEFRERLQLEDKYPRFSSLKARVIEPAAQELTLKTSIDVEWSSIKEGKVVVRLEFRFVEKQQMQLDF